MKPLLKICGTTSIPDARLAQEASADFLGMIVDFPPSPRHVPLEKAVEIAGSVSLPVIAVTVNQSLEQLLRIHKALSPHALQLHGDETPELVQQLVKNYIRVWAVASGERPQVLSRAKTMSQAGAEAILIDARLSTAEGTIYGGTGHVGDWEATRMLVDEGYRVILAGGLNAENIADAIEQVEPWMVDVASGVEAQKGVKDRAKVLSFAEKVILRRDA
jgi:phosphoribosylanthranilate isomerase